MPTRISGACNACRSKKQKCSGDKSGCAQCEAAGITCTWPEQRKRGPAKGYIEGLEHRLHDAESLLLQLLPLVSTEQLQIASSALVQDGNESGRDSPDRRSSPPVLNKKTGIEYWENFPLTSAAAIRRWQQDCETHGGSSGNMNRSELQARGSSPASHFISASDNTGQHRRSLQGPPTSTSFPGPGVSDTSLDDLFRMQNVRRPSAQIMNVSPRQQQQQEQIAMSINHNPRGSPWQTPPPPQAQMMNMNIDRSQGDITQTQMFTNVGYLNASGPWSHQQHHTQQQQQQQQQQGMPMDLDHHAIVTSGDSIPMMTSQPPPHIFW